MENQNKKILFKKLQYLVYKSMDYCMEIRYIFNL